MVRGACGKQGGLARTTRGITPGSDLVPCIVCVLPDDVTPYAKIVTVYMKSKWADDSS